MKKYLGTKGRITKVELLLITIILFIIEVLICVFFKYNSDILISLTFLIFIIYLIQCVKRFHDLNMSAVFGYLWWSVPIANIYYFYLLYFKDGEPIENQYKKPSRFNKIGGQNIRYKEKVKSDNTDISQSSTVTLQNNVIEDEKEYYYKNEKFENLPFPTLGGVISYMSIQHYLYETDREIKFNKEPLPNIFKIKDVFLIEWKKDDEEYCREGDKICRVFVKREYNTIELNLLSNKKGLLKIEDSFNRFGISKIQDNQIIFTIEDFTGYSAYNVSKIEEDKFTKTQVLKWSRVGANRLNWYGIEKEMVGFLHLLFDTRQRIFLTINNIEGEDFLVFNYPRKNLDIRSGDLLQFLLETDEVIDLYFSQNSYFIYESSDSDIGKIFENKIHISSKVLDLLATYKIINWQIVFQTGQTVSGFKSYGANHAYSTYDELQDVTKSLFVKYKEELKKITNYQPMYEFDDDTNDNNKIINIKNEECYVYLMIDTTNNFYKIGISNNPEYRERTLQSEKPTIELIESKKFPIRKIAESFEKSLHNTYDDKRIRGEWFELSPRDVDNIIESLK